MRELRPEELYRKCEPELLEFETTADLEPAERVLGQPRAVAAVDLGIGIEREGYNIFAYGPAGVGKHRAIRRFLERRAQKQDVPPDLCYVNNFDEAQKPRLLMLPAGRGRDLRKDLDEVIHELSTTLSAAFESEEYQSRAQVIESQFEQLQEKAVSELGEAAREKGIALLRTPMGMVFAPLKGEEEVFSPEEFKQLGEEEQAQLKGVIDEFQGELQKIFRQLPIWKREKQSKLRKLNEEVGQTAVGPVFEDLRGSYEGLEEVLAFLESVETDVMSNASSLVPSEESKAAETLMALGAGHGQGSSPLRRYRVNLLVERAEGAGAPVVYEPNPTYQNLIGKVENISQQGALVTDFSLVRGGALHRANGGYLMLDADKLLLQPYAWEGLKRALRSGRIKIESLGEALSLISTYSLEPEPVPLDVKIILLGEPRLYYLMSFYDPDLRKLFKVAADFGDRLDRGPETEKSYARLIAALAAGEELRPFERPAVARVIEHGARMLADSEKLSLNLGSLRDLLVEADYWADSESREAVSVADVEHALSQKIYRSDRVRERVQESILRETILIDTEGAVTGRINGLSVLQIGDFSFGQPSRITARVRLGKGEVINIERQVDLSGPSHSKGVLILAGFLGARYARKTPLALSASLVFEQSYGGVDGDSASSTELYALLSAIAEVPIRQSLAVTGSINQHGEVQAIGGVNEKIEGFFDVCQARGLTGDQGVLIPASNVKHLMLRHDVVEAVAAGNFHIYPVAHVDEGIELLTGLEAGERDAEGNYPADSANDLVERRLAELARTARAFSRPAEKPELDTGEADEEPDGGET
ncbi:MAG: AAA family ATPase [bacterium]|nr:AAA family ATPase [bacterium]